MEVRILYRNYKGETSWRRIIPKRIWFGRNEWHPEEQWLLEALDIEKDAIRDLAMKDILEWKDYH
jgi:predicted DNA-binding transcriptional regulator YafY